MMRSNKSAVERSSSMARFFSFLRYSPLIMVEYGTLPAEVGLMGLPSDFRFCGSVTWSIALVIASGAAKSPAGVVGLTLIGSGVCTGEILFFVIRLDLLFYRFLITSLQSSFLQALYYWCQINSCRYLHRYTSDTHIVEFLILSVQYWP